MSTAFGTGVAREIRNPRAKHINLNWPGLGKSVRIAPGLCALKIHGA
jgi:hypothetical protein